jgi:hypothetical protein
MQHPRPSCMMTKIKWDRGSPCRMPQAGEKGCDRTSLTRMEKKVDEVSFIIQEIQLFLNPKVIIRQFI